MADERARIRAVFLERRDTYSAPVAAQLSGITRQELLDRIASGEVESAPRVTHWIPWDDVARVLMERVPLETIYDALGDRADEVLPPLLRLARLDIQVPAFILRILEWAAQERGQTVEHYLQWELFDIVESLWRMHPSIDRHIPGVAEALFFPDDPPRRKRS